MTYKDICKEVKKIQRRYRESDPFRLCEAMGIIVRFESLGVNKTAIKGFFLVSNRIRTITINSDLPQTIQRIIIAHELGHAVLHKNTGVCSFHEVELFDSSSFMEKEANLFAAEFLLNDSDVMECLNADNTFFSAAAQLSVPMELIDFKFRIMKWKGYKLMEPPINSNSNFLKDMEVPDNYDNYAC